jgi:hypothetical protein
MKKGFTFLLATGLCALIQVGAAAQSKDVEISAKTTTIIDAGKATPAELQVLSPDELRDRLNEAKQLLKSNADLSEGKTVTLAVFDPRASHLHLLTLQKESFLTKDANLLITSQLGRALRLTVIRANGVNTAVNVTDPANGQALTPLMVAYPIVRDGAVTEVAYYASAHPALLSSEITDDGSSYVTSMLDQAAKNLSAKGVQIPSDIVDIAQHLCVVEHTDHKRFMTEEHSELFPEILSLYALNQGNTFRYSVSTAGAGGMIQMIPRTYEGIRQQHTNVPLQADFVDGMRNHDNALEAMLLYINDTWNKLQESEEVQDALRTGTATKAELLAAGYNSNPGRLPGYLKDGGANWRTLIPAETQMYLAIYSEVDRNVKFRGYSSMDRQAGTADFGMTSPPRTSTLMTWLSGKVLSGTTVLLRILS